jgi:hypothetical protein
MKTMFSRLALSALLFTVALRPRCDGAWNWIQWGEGARPVSQTTVSCWLMDPQGKLLFVVFLRGKPGWYNAQTTHDGTSSDAGFQWKWRVGKIAYTIDYRGTQQQVRLFGQSVSLNEANIIAVDLADTAKPQVRGIARVNVRVNDDDDAVQLAQSGSQAVRSWISAK